MYLHVYIYIYIYIYSKRARAARDPAREGNPVRREAGLTQLHTPSFEQTKHLPRATSKAASKQHGAISVEDIGRPCADGNLTPRTRGDCFGQAPSCQIIVSERLFCERGQLDTPLFPRCVHTACPSCPPVFLPFCPLLVSVKKTTLLRI